MALDGFDSQMRAVSNGAVSVPINSGGRTNASVELRAGASLCGNGVIDPGEECDDGNRVSGDGCSFECLREDGGTDSGRDGSSTDVAAQGDSADTDVRTLSDVGTSCSAPLPTIEECRANGTDLFNGGLYCFDTPADLGQRDMCEPDAGVVMSANYYAGIACPIDVATLTAGTIAACPECVGGSEVAASGAPGDVVAGWRNTPDVRYCCSGTTVRKIERCPAPDSTDGGRLSADAGSSPPTQPHPSVPGCPANTALWGTRCPNKYPDGTVCVLGCIVDNAGVTYDPPGGACYAATTWENQGAAVCLRAGTTCGDCP
jgi:cysteine-rich repeat protein